MYCFTFRLLSVTTQTSLFLLLQVYFLSVSSGVEEQKKRWSREVLLFLRKQRFFHLIALLVFLSGDWVSGGASNPLTLHFYVCFCVLGPGWSLVLSGRWSLLITRAWSPPPPFCHSSPGAGGRVAWVGVEQLVPVANKEKKMSCFYHLYIYFFFFFIRINK